MSFKKKKSGRVGATPRQFRTPGITRLTYECIGENQAFIEVLKPILSHFAWRDSTRASNTALSSNSTKASVLLAKPVLWSVRSNLAKSMLWSTTDFSGRVSSDSQSDLKSVSGPQLLPGFLLCTRMVSLVMPGVRNCRGIAANMSGFVFLNAIHYGGRDS